MGTFFITASMRPFAPNKSGKFIWGHALAVDDPLKAVKRHARECWQANAGPPLLAAVYDITGWTPRLVTGRPPWPEHSIYTVVKCDDCGSNLLVEYEPLRDYARALHQFERIKLAPELLTEDG